MVEPGQEEVKKATEEQEEEQDPSKCIYETTEVEEKTDEQVRLRVLSF